MQTMIDNLFDRKTERRHFPHVVHNHHKNTICIQVKLMILTK